MGWFEGVGVRARRRGWLVLGYGVVPGLSTSSSSDSGSDENAPCSDDASSDSSSRGSGSRDSSSGGSESDGEDEILGSESGANSN